MARLRFLIVFGPTQEPIDPVRYISNCSTGTMGRNLVAEAKRKGHKVTAVECPKDARTARELERKLHRLLPKTDVLIMAAAVCDARPARVSKTKIKKELFSSIKLVRNPDILAGLARRKKKSQIFIGFGLESKDILKNGFGKMQKKNLEVIVIQRVINNQNPFGNKKIEALVLKKDGSITRFPSADKRKIAGFLVQEAQKLKAQRVIDERTS